jgi:hypothetical protein
MDLFDRNAKPFRPPSRPEPARAALAAIAKMDKTIAQMQLAGRFILMVAVLPMEQVLNKLRRADV